MRMLAVVLMVCWSGAAAAQSEAPSTEPFAWGDFTWINGNSRQTQRVLENDVFTGQVDLDINYTLSARHPIDDTVVGSTALARDNELELGFVALGGDLHYHNVRGRLLLQFGTRSTLVPRNDTSVQRGQFDLSTAYRYISEAYTGYHWDVWHGLNVDAGIFLSYVGMFSYAAFENWAYQPSYTSDNTPWFFNGLRVQAFLTDRLKMELWLINGWQSYGKFNTLPGAGVQGMWRPMEALHLVSNNYVGTDTRDHPGRVRFHTDNSVQVRYFNDPEAGLSRGAFTVTVDLGFESGSGVTAFGGRDGPAQNFVSGMAYHRLWFLQNQLGWTVGGGFIHNPGGYLVLAPPGAASVSMAPGSQFDAWDISTTLDWMPTQWSTWRLEVVHRNASVRYFASRGGVTSPDGYTPPAPPADWRPDTGHDETRLIVAFIARF